MKTGIDVLDAAGGIPENSNVLLIGPPGPDKMKVSLKALREALQAGKKGVYVTTDQFPGDIEKKSKEFAMDITEFTNKSLWFIDCYSWTLSEERKKTERKDIIVPGPSALNDLSIGIAQSLRQSADSPNIIFQSLSTLLLYNNPEIVYRFVQIMGARLKVAKATTLFHCESGMHDEKVITTLKHLVDVVIEMKVEAGKISIFSPSIGLREWKELTL